jgi:hypothetical protein
VPRLLRLFRGWGLFPVHQGQFTKRCLLQEIGGFDAAAKLASDVNQYYDLENKTRLKIRCLRFDVAFMRAGGAANASLMSVYRGTVEVYRHLLLRHSSPRALGMVFVKTLQSISEIRFGRCPHDRWFTAETSQPVP